MCGIVGVASQAMNVDPLLLVSMRDQLRHRGPDDAGEWISADGHVGLAHRRLSIIDLSPNGHQPMADSSAKLYIVFNGEIYNYRELRTMLAGMGHKFRTSSDTEVILEAYRAWGVDCVRRLNGMFAFCLYDVDNYSVFMARDRAGEKPLFYRHASKQLICASELKALMADPEFPRNLDMQAFQYYLAYGYVNSPSCLLAGVHKLAAAHAMTYSLKSDSLSIWRYWSLPEPPPISAKTSEQDLTEELGQLLRDSVKRQLVADVPVGILLSGGLDSSLVTAIAAEVSSQPVRTFTVTFPGSGSHDETPFARIVADHFGTKHTELVGEPTNVDLLPELARQYDEPIADQSLVPTYIVSRLIRGSATVALGGDGADELFGGYPHYSWIQLQNRIRCICPKPLRETVSSIATSLFQVGTRGRNYLTAFGNDLPSMLSHVNLFFDAQTRDSLIGLGNGRHVSAAVLTPEHLKIDLCRFGTTALQKATALDFQTYLTDDILVKVDRASMLASLEVRAPWLDYRIIEFAFGKVPDVLKVRGRNRKVLPKRLAKHLLPRTLNLSRKQGFTLPLNHWFRGKWGVYIESVLAEAEPNLFNRDEIRKLFTNQRRGYSNTHRLFALTMFELWRRHYKVDLPL